MKIFAYIFKAIFIVLFGFNPALVGDVLDELDRLQIAYVVEDIEQAGFYDSAKDLIYIDRDSLGNAYTLKAIVAHEVIHKIRFVTGFELKSRRLEEAIAVYGSEKVSRLLGFGHVDIHLKSWFLKTLKINGLPEEALTSKELEIVQQEIKLTIEAVEKFLESKQN